MQIGIIGTGMVGSAIAYSLASEGSAEKLILIDANVYVRCPCRRRRL